MMVSNVVPLSLAQMASRQAIVRVPSVGAILPFPLPIPGMFTPEMRNSLVVFGLALPGMRPVMFELDEVGNEVCRMADCIAIGWDRRQSLCVSDVQSGFVDHGPFESVDEVFDLIAYIVQ